MSAMQILTMRMARSDSAGGWPPLRWFMLLAALALTFAMCGAAARGQASGSTAPASTVNPYTYTPSNVVGQQGSPSAINPNTGLTNSMGTTGNGGQGNGTAGPAMPTTMLYPDPKQYVLNAGDLIYVRLYGSQDYFSTDRISRDGTVELPLIGAVNVANITVRQGEELIADKLRSAGMYKNPQITITIAESVVPQTVTVAGEIHGVFPVQGQRTLLDVLSGLGGLPPTASRTVSILRPGATEPIMVNVGTTPQEMLSANVPVFPHDTIFVERAGVVYVVGAFRSNGAFVLQPGRMTLMQLAALSGGPLYQAKYDDMRIVRTTGTQRSEVKIDMKRVLYGKDPDPILQSGDIIFLPNSTVKTALSNGGLGSLLGVLSLIVALQQR